MLFLRINIIFLTGPVDVERIFHRVNVSGTDMISYAEWEAFLNSKEANEYCPL